MNFQQFCGSDKSMIIECEVFNGSVALGKCEFTIKEIEEENKKEFTLTNESGTIVINSLKVEDKEKVDPNKPKKKKKKINIKKWPHSFLEYIRSGAQINVSIAVDFTGSNGSLHNIKPNSENQYQKGMRSVADIVLDYDSDKSVPMYGFGGNFFGKGTSHCFPLNNDHSNPEVKGLEGIM
mmetsp:Transcript_18333/g.15972  ORF Transcript_18333/g.15972 Transcript_18333/m.15972 type:complete len:180 (+) Transcript_18333:708-1247(+)|eukprot:CAMPEP_0114588608 /NCGR_PEP_ID=MMETSP0125-20121206/11265_1 /TAXON_ID=485358 ORGANISM="Aristerostoma sp., Strain ATCC 50986" /NCGR_SAMPLE_ID=MMETSP0125 /ASSEMBLY_ACC=CAM_ASM_000245 /LENGTH=179 /DNA_ID=CAMNT_0001785083 /DNA_START=668 /DNA_END=1207 /DNA_ORIENTATION=-